MRMMIITTEGRGSGTTGDLESLKQVSDGRLKEIGW